MGQERIVQILPGMRRAGAESVTANLCQGLVELGAEVHLVVIGNKFEYQESLAEKGIHLHLLHLYQGPLRFYRQDIHWNIRRQLGYFFKKNRPDIAHFHLPHALLWGGVQAFRFGANCFYTAHGQDPDLLSSHPVSRYRRWSFIRALKGSHAHVLAVSAGVADHVERGIPQLNVEVQANPLSYEFLKPIMKPPLFPRRALMLGTLYPLKRVHIGIEALQILAESDQFELWVVGGGPEEEKLQALVRAKGLRNKITFFGVRKDPATWLGQAGVVWLLSEREGMPMVALEAMAMGIPLIATDVSGIRELLRHEENALLVPLDQPQAVAQASRRLWEDLELRQRIITGGIATSHRFHPTMVAQQHLVRYRQGMGRL